MLYSLNDGEKMNFIKWVFHCAIAFAATSYWVVAQFSLLWWVLFILLIPLPASYFSLARSSSK
jgi:hypothetical protein